MNDHLIIKGNENSNFRHLWFIKKLIPKIEIEFIAGIKDIFYLNQVIHAEYYYLSKSKYCLTLTFSNNTKREIIGDILPLILELLKL